MIVPDQTEIQIPFSKWRWDAYGLVEEWIRPIWNLYLNSALALLSLSRARHWRCEKTECLDMVMWWQVKCITLTDLNVRSTNSGKGADRVWNNKEIWAEQSVSGNTSRGRQRQRPSTVPCFLTSTNRLVKEERVVYQVNCYWMSCFIFLFNKTQMCAEWTSWLHWKKKHKNLTFGRSHHFRTGKETCVSEIAWCFLTLGRHFKDLWQIWKTDTFEVSSNFHSFFSIFTFCKI